MKLLPVEFKGEQVGLKIVAESPQGHHLLECLAGLKAEKCWGFRHFLTGGALFLAPHLPWNNVQNIQSDVDA